MTESTEKHAAEHRRGVGRTMRIGGLIVSHLFNGFLDRLSQFIEVLSREIELFLGTALVLIGVFSFESDKFCDGNTADYLSCTRPSTYYYFSSLDIACIVLGSFLILFWIMRSRE
ncbi:MAG: hypothetical protein KBE09_01310 [Candidatus Pacebacteria bacterium]|nr:hypothetical protein [Candidatus Paceibacterota bacterium]